MRVVLAHGPGGMFDVLPVLFLGVAIYIIRNVLREGQDKAKTTAKLPTTPWSRQVHSATRKRAADKPAAQAERPGQVRRFGPPRLKVMDGEAAEANRPVVPRKFEPPPPAGRRKTG